MERLASPAVHHVITRTTVEGLEEFAPFGRRTGAGLVEVALDLARASGNIVARCGLNAETLYGGYSASGSGSPVGLAGVLQNDQITLTLGCNDALVAVARITSSKLDSLVGGATRRCQRDPVIS